MPSNGLALQSFYPQVTTNGGGFYMQTNVRISGGESDQAEFEHEVDAEDLEPDSDESLDWDSKNGSSAGRNPKGQARRLRSRTPAERQQKKARLEMREAILKDLRTQLADGGSGAVTELRESCDSFEERLRQASIWPLGSHEWARQLLGIDRRMSPSDMRQRYLSMVKLVHPDRHQFVSQDAIRLVNTAWEILQQSGDFQ